MKIARATSSYRIAIAGFPDVIGQRGVPAESKKLEIPWLTYSLFPLPISSHSHQQIEILVHVSNFVYGNSGGIYLPIVLGDQEELRRDYLFSKGKEIAVGGVLSILAMYHLMVYWLRRADKASFFFSLVYI